MKTLKGQLRTWNKNSFGKVEGEKEALKKVKVLDDLEVLKPLSSRERERELKLEAMQEFKRWALMEEVFWRQKSRDLVEGRR